MKERQIGYYVEIKRGSYVKDGDKPTERFPAGGLSYSGSLTKEQMEGLDGLIRDYLDGKTVQTEELSKLTKPALVGNTRFGVGVSERMVVERAQREYEYQVTPEKEAERMKRVEAFRAELAGPVVTDAMVDRFLSWKLPEDFHPDAGISFSPYFNVEYNAKHGKPPQRHDPIGTNLLTAIQARAMLEHVLACAVSPQASPSEPAR